MRKQDLLIIVFILCGIPWCSATDSLRYLVPNDTLYVETDAADRKYFERTLQEGQTLWSLCRYFGLKPNELYSLNPGLDTQSSIPGTKVRIPLPNAAIKRYAIPGFQPSKHVPICYVVKKGDTIYGIAKRNYQMPIDTLVQRNKLTNLTLELGQVLHTGWLSLAGIPDSLQNHQALLSFDKDSPNVIRYEEERRRYNQRGPAVYLQSKGKGKVVAVLHNKAKLGSVIEIFCPATRKKVFAKVAGRIPAGVHDPDTVAVLSNYAAKILGVRNARFFVEIKY